MASSHSPDTKPRVLSERTAYRLSAAVIGIGLFASVTPSTLYHTYGALWHFSPFTLTLIYATYAFGVLGSLLVLGRTSDQVGRRPVLLASLGALMLSAILFMAASSATWLFFARGLQGLATGAALSAASASLLDLHPRRDTTSVALANGVASTLGIGLGVLISSWLVELGVAPRELPYAVLLTLFAGAFAFAFFMPEPVLARGPLRLTLHRPAVPPAVRRPFFLAGLAVFSSWSIGGLFFSLGPQLSAQMFDSSNIIVSGIGIVTLAASATVAQLMVGRTAPWLAASAGSIALAVGMLLIVAAVATTSPAAYLAGCVVGGIGFGVAFLGGLRVLVAAIPQEQRAAVMSAFYIVAYASLSVPAILAGLVVRRLGLATTFEVFGSIAAAVALLVAREGWRMRPRAPRSLARDVSPGQPGGTSREANGEGRGAMGSEPHK